MCIRSHFKPVEIYLKDVVNRIETVTKCPRTETINE